MYHSFSPGPQILTGEAWETVLSKGFDEAQHRGRPRVPGEFDLWPPAGLCDLVQDHHPRSDAQRVADGGGVLQACSQHAEGKL